MNKTENGDSIILNSRYLNKNQGQLPDYVIAYLKEMNGNPLSRLNSELVRKAIEWLNDPMNSNTYRNYILFNNISDNMSENERYVKPGFEVVLPLVKIDF